MCRFLLSQSEQLHADDATLLPFSYEGVHDNLLPLVKSLRFGQFGAARYQTGIGRRFGISLSGFARVYFTFSPCQMSRLLLKLFDC